MKLIGILLLLNGMAISSWWITTQGTHKGTVLTLAFLAVFAGLALILSDRITELTVKGVGTIKAAAEKAESDADEIEEIRKRVEAQAATMDLVAKESAQAKELLNSMKEQNKVAEERIEILSELASPPQLILKNTEITKFDGGYQAIMEFTPSKNRPFGVLLFFAAIEGESNANILDFWPARPPHLTGDDSRQISQDGKKARLQYQAMATGVISVRLRTSAPARVEIKGNHDLETFIVDLK